MAVLPPEATFGEFCDYTRALRGELPDEELSELWEWRQKLLGLRWGTGRGMRSMLHEDEQHLTLRERARMQVDDAKAQGINLEYAGRRWV